MFVLNIVFVYKGLKQGLIQQTKSNWLLQISYNSYDYFKIASCAVCVDLATSLLLYLSRLFASLILLHKFMLILTRNIPRFMRTKADKVCIFS